ncbi:MAG: PilN domain-containing protein [Bryobacteraceae bacterium]
MNLSRAPINLASHPFKRERAEIALLAAICAVLTVSLLIFTGLILEDRAQVSTLRESIRNDQRMLAAIELQQAHSQSIIGRPDNADVFAKSVFYNELIARRAVSWTRVFDDLGRVMPPSVQLISLRLPQVAAETEGGRNHIELDMLVGAREPQAIMPLFKKLQESPLFGAAEISSQAPPTQNDPLFRFRLTVPYVQRF